MPLRERGPLRNAAAGRAHGDGNELRATGNLNDGSIRTDGDGRSAGGHDDGVVVVGSPDQANGKQANNDGGSSNGLTFFFSFCCCHTELRAWPRPASD